MDVVPIKLSEANAFVKRYHRHHKPTVGHICSVAVAEGDKVVGVAIVGRPVARRLDNGLRAEVLRCCTDGTKNACSMLYAAAWRAVRALGYKEIGTYILDTEPGTSLKAAGWKCLGKCGGGSWDCKSRPRVNKHPEQLKIRWVTQKTHQSSKQCVSQSQA